MRTPIRPQVDLMKENGDIRSDLTLPGGTDEADRVAQQLKEEFEKATGDIIVVVLKSMGTEMIMSLKVVPVKN
jgi:translation initiation factor 5A